MTEIQIAPRIERADPRTAPIEVLRAVAEHREMMRAEWLPLDPPWPPDMLITEMRHVSSDEDVIHWGAWDGGRVVGHAALFLPLRENLHLSFVGLGVQAPYRRRGLGRALLREVAALAQSRGRTQLVGQTTDRAPAGEVFARKVGGQAALEGHINQLDLSELDRATLDGWTLRGEERAPDYKLWLQSGPYPEARLADIAELHGVMNTAPRGDLDMGDWRVTPERLREWEAQLIASGQRRLSAFAEHRESGALVGYTELVWHPQRSALLFQHATGVNPAHRRRGLGRWLKAANLRAALAENPAARFVRTGNADTNEGMLAINSALGFKPFLAETDWQADLASVRAYLAGQ